MARASYQQLPNIILGEPRPKKKVIKGPSFSSSTFSPVTPVVKTVRTKKPILKLKFPS